MTLIDEWRYLGPRLWSVRLAIASALFGALEVVLPFVQEFIPPGVFAGLSVVAALGSAAARLIQQTELQNTPEK